jgi:hypothetical protein
MPLTKKGNKIMGAMQDKYGEEKGEKIFYASKNKGTISGVEKAKTGKAFGPPPKSGPQPQGIKKAFLGGMSDYMKINRFLDSVVYPTAIKTKLAHENERRRKRAQQNLEKQKQISQAYDYLGKEYGPPKSGPQPQGMNQGGTSQGAKFVKYFGEQFNQNKDKILKEAVTGLFKKDFGSRFKNIMNQAQSDFYAQEGTTPYNTGFVAYNPKKEETGISTKETMGLKHGGFGCPHRETGAQSNIKGVKAIQKTGEKFTGIK